MAGPQDNRFARLICETEEAVLATHPTAAHFRYPYAYGPLQVVPREWMEQATRVNDDILANEPEENHRYGLGFWCNDRGALWPNLPRDSFSAAGAGRR